MMKPEELKLRLRGITIISITPFKENGDFDGAGYEKNLKFLLDGGVNKENSVIVICGSTGECGAMSISERKMIMEMVYNTIGDSIPIIQGCNSTNVNESIELAHHAQEHGASGIMSLSPYYYPAKDENCIYAFYEKLAANTDLGILLYNNFEVMNVDCPISILNRLKKIPNIVGMKECTPAFFKMTRVVQEIGDEVSVVNGHGEFLEPYAALAGTVGFISSMSNIVPERAVAIWKARSIGDYEEAKRIRDTMIPYMDLAVKYSGEGGEYKVIALLKYMADLAGSYGGYARIPVVPLTDSEKREAYKVAEQIGIV